MNLPESVVDRLRCPYCAAPFEWQPSQLVCESCQRRFPIVGGVPILINEERSLFRSASFVTGQSTTVPGSSWLRRTSRKLLPQLGANLPSRANYSALTTLLLQRRAEPRILVVGGRRAGEGMEGMARLPKLQFLYTDVTLGGETQLVCDAHDLPFLDETFDAVIAQAVLEHVVDPARCVGEIHRVLTQEGLIYAETPFMQQVHMGRYDFMRFSPLAHRLLFAQFDEVRAGLVGGPATVLAWSYHYFLRSFASSARGKAAAAILARLTAFWLKYFDRALVNRPGAWDGAWGTYFLGTWRDGPIDDRVLLEEYRGLG